MKIIEPSAQVWKQNDIIPHIARCARVCYKSEPKVENADKDKALVQRLISSGHLSMLRHATSYFLFPRNHYENDKKLKSLYLNIYSRNHVFGCFVRSKYGTLFSMNGQTYYELPPSIHNMLEPYRVHENDFFGTDERQEFWPVRFVDAYRTTVSMITQISTSRELNRTSPNNIAEQSTRYVNFGKKGGIAICKPHWYDNAAWWRKLLARMAWRTQEFMYDTALWLGMKPEDARGFLPLDTATQVVYTYTNKEWRHIFDLRVRETTGKAHPNAKLVCSLAKDAIEQRMHMFHSKYSL